MEKIKAILILEILGRPADYVAESLKNIVEKLGKENDVKMVTSRIAETKENEQHKGLFTSFAEIEIETSITKFSDIIFNYMPSHIEIVHPEELKIKNYDLNTLFVELMKRLHQYDEIAKAMIIENQNVKKRLDEINSQKQEDIKVKEEIETKSNKKKKSKKN